MEDNSEVKIVVNSFKCEYAGCGSHQIELTINIDNEELVNFLKQFSLCQCIKPVVNKWNGMTETKVDESCGICDGKGFIKL